MRLVQYLKMLTRRLRNQVNPSSRLCAISGSETTLCCTLNASMANGAAQCQVIGGKPMRERTNTSYRTSRKTCYVDESAILGF